jgi:hypothetical protein
VGLTPAKPSADSASHIKELTTAGTFEHRLKLLAIAPSAGSSIRVLTYDLHRSEKIVILAQSNPR